MFGDHAGQSEYTVMHVPRVPRFRGARCRGAEQAGGFRGDERRRTLPSYDLVRGIAVLVPRGQEVVRGVTET